MTGGMRDQPFESPEAVAIALHQSFPAYRVTVRRDGREPRYQLVSLDGRNPVVLISPDPDEIRAELDGTEQEPATT
jgi:hypothetical protein